MWEKAIIFVVRRVRLIALPESENWLVTSSAD
jgi:hypothetical protein